MSHYPVAPADSSYCVAPAWLEYSGLPVELNRVRKNAWTIFKKLVELDCARHPEVPGMVEATAEEIAVLTGFEGAAVLKACDGFRRKGLLRCFLPDHPDEQMFYEVPTPLPVPRPDDEIRRDMEERIGPQAARAPWRYRARTPGHARDENLHRRTVELYLNHMSSALNATTTDELAILADRYPLEKLREAFRTAEVQGERHLGWIFRYLRARHDRQADRKPRVRENR